jgi:hypothetical protein
VAAERPRILDFGGEEARRRYEQEFKRLYCDRNKPVVDVLGQRVKFYRNSWEHVCFKGDPDDPNDYGGRYLWKQYRAVLIPWIEVALKTPTEVRPNLRYRERFSYLLWVPAEPELALPQVFFGVVTAPSGPKEVDFVTAYPMTHKTWTQWRRGGKPYYEKAKG